MFVCLFFFSFFYHFPRPSEIRPAQGEYNEHFLFARISFALDEKGRPTDSSSVSRPAVLHGKNTAVGAKSAKKLSGGPDRNNNVLMEFYLNKVRTGLCTLTYHATFF